MRKQMYIPERSESPTPDESRTVELRVHGVGGATPVELLQNPHVQLVAGDHDAGFYRTGSAVTDDNRDAEDSDDSGPVREAYAWGGLTSRSSAQAAWLALLPFALVNVAGWMVPAHGGSQVPPSDPDGTSDGGNGEASTPDPATSDRGHGAGSRWRTLKDIGAPSLVRILALLMTIMLVVWLSIPMLDQIAWRCAGRAACAWDGPLSGVWTYLELNEHPGRRLTVGLIVSVLVVLVLSALGRRSTLRYEEYSLSWMDGLPATPRNLSQAAFWNNADMVKTTGALHVTAAYAAIALIASAGLLQASDIALQGSQLPAVLVVMLGAMGLLVMSAVTLVVISYKDDAGLERRPWLFGAWRVWWIGPPEDPEDDGRWWQVFPDRWATFPRRWIPVLVALGLVVAIGVVGWRSEIVNAEGVEALKSPVQGAYLLLGFQVLVVVLTGLATRWKRMLGLVLLSVGVALLAGLYDPIELGPSTLAAFIVGVLGIGWLVSTANAEADGDGDDHRLEADPDPEVKPPLDDDRLPPKSRKTIGRFRGGGAWILCAIAVFAAAGTYAGIALWLERLLFEADAIVESNGASPFDAQAYSWHAWLAVALIASLTISLLVFLLRTARIWIGDRCMDAETLRHYADWKFEREGGAGGEPSSSGGWIGTGAEVRAARRRWARRISISHWLADVTDDLDVLAHTVAAIGMMIGVATAFHALLAGIDVPPEQPVRVIKFADDVAAASENGFGWIPQVAASAAALLPIVGFQLVRRAFGDARSRRNIGILWDVATFWPRRYHPLAPPCYAERAVPQLAERLRILTTTSSPDGPAARVITLAHSQGSMMAVAAISMLLNGAQDDSEGPLRNWSPEAARLITVGSPISRLYRRSFPCWVTPELLEKVCTTLGQQGWRNLFRDTDYIGGRIFGPDSECANDITSESITDDRNSGKFVNQWATREQKMVAILNSPVDVRLDDPDHRDPSPGNPWPRPQTHGGYWDDRRVRMTVDALA